MDKEQVYDNLIYPHMEAILVLCRQHGIAMLATFACPTKDHPHLQVTSHVSDESGWSPYTEHLHAIAPSITRETSQTPEQRFRQAEVDRLVAKRRGEQPS